MLQVPLKYLQLAAVALVVVVAQVVVVLAQLNQQLVMHQ
jgi:hypothetical protein